MKAAPSRTRAAGAVAVLALSSAPALTGCSSSHKASAAKTAASKAASAGRSASAKMSAGSKMSPSAMASKAKNAACSIHTNAGSCYQAGQTCRTADEGKSTTDTQGRTVKCVKSGNGYRWEH